MATSQPALTAGRGLEAVRITLLNADGSRNCDTTDTTAYTMCPQSVAVSVDETAGETQTIRCGSGDVFASFVTAASTDGLTITVQLVDIDIELIALATGATLLTSSGDNIGWSGGESENSIPTEVHAWENAWAGNAAAASPFQYWHHAWPHVNFKLQQQNIEEGFGNGRWQLVGRVAGNLNLGNGSFLDIPVEAFESSSHFHAQWRDSDIPDVDSAPYNNGLGGGFINTPACVS